MNPKINVKLNFVKKLEIKGSIKLDFEKPRVKENEYYFPTTTSMNSG